MISYIIVSYNTCELTNKAVASIIEHCEDFEIIVVDNCSTDRTVETIRNSHYGSVVRVIESNKNLGFSKANNLGFKYSTGEYIVFVNPDTVFLSDVGSELYNEYKLHYLKMNVILSPQILNPNGTEQHCQNLFPRINFATAFKRFNKLLRNKLLNRVYSEWITGVCYGIERGLVEKIGGWNEQYDLYAEDLDICYRLKKFFKGKCYVIKQIHLKHYGNQSGKQVYNTTYQLFEKKTDSLKKFFELYYSDKEFEKYLKRLYIINKDDNIKKYIENHKCLNR